MSGEQSWVLRKNAPMPWKPAFPPMPPHPAQTFDFSLAELLAPDGQPLGHLLVFAEPYARKTGHLWWKTLSAPSLTLEFWSYVHGEFDDQFLSNIEDVDAAVEVLQRGQWPPLGWDALTTYRLRWLDIDQSRRASAEVFGLDLEAERRIRKRLD